MTPLDTVLERYVFPFETIMPQQIETVNDLAPLQNCGHWLDVGVGKTFTATACSLFHLITLGHQVVVIMPPVLIKQWGRWIRSIKSKPGVPDLTLTEYRGTAAKRAKLSMEVDFVLVGVQMFRKEYIKFYQHYRDLQYTVIIDEATLIAGINSDQHEKVFEFSIGHHRIPLSGTPIGNPLYGYGLMKFSAPGSYRSYQHFLNTHVAENDFFGNPAVFTELDLLHDKLMVNSKRFLYEDVYKGTQTPLFVKIDYDMEAKHYRLYEKLADEQLLLLPDGGKIDATTASKLLHALGQIVVNQSHFSGLPSDKSNAIALVQEKLDELGDKKLIVFSYYQMTTRALVDAFKKKYGAVSIYGEVSPAQKDQARDKFVDDPACRVIIIQQRSGGFGLDGLQHVCHHAFFIEPCPQPIVFTQCVGRLKRMGQRKRVMVWIAVAAGTLQVRGFNNLLTNDAIVNQVIRNAYDLRQVIFGN